MEQKTPLYQAHLTAEGKIVPFAGFLLPVQYSAGVIAEHLTVREDVGLFDVSHMGEAMLEGPGALAALHHLMTNDFTNLAVGGCRYTLMLYPDGGQVDDLIVYRMGQEKFLLVLNASNTQKDIDWMRQNLQGDCVLKDISAQVAQIALQGPKSREVIAEACNPAELPTKNYTFTASMHVAGVPCLVSRTGYTGEFGYELYMNPECAQTVWDELLANGAKPCGLGARDTLRLEAAMPLYGHELGAEIHAASVGLGFAIKLQKEEFIGKEALQNPPSDAPVRVGIKVTGRGIVREGAALLQDGVQVGVSTSGTHCPYLGGAYAMAYLSPAASAVGTQLIAQVRGREIAVEVVPLPFYKTQA
ncbi:MAG: glycine cleavage system aminomethyltransferase GcvT [Faecalibacterium sp.]